MKQTFCNEAGLLELAALKENWNSHGAPPIDPRCIAAVREFRNLYLRCARYTGIADFVEPENLPRAVPTVHGGIMLAWEGERYTLEFGPDGEQRCE